MELRNDTFKAWSLSGTHLMIVACIEGPQSISWSADDLIAEVQLQDWIYDGIYTIKSGYPTVAIGTAVSIGNNGLEEKRVLLKKTGDRYLGIYATGDGLTFENWPAIRIQFDLVIM